jgi:hypothetical protein
VNLDFDTMTKTELRAYLVAHPNDREAFYAFVDRFTSEASPQTFSLAQTQADIEEIEQLIQQKISGNALS